MPFSEIYPMVLHKEVISQQSEKLQRIVKSELASEILTQVECDEARYWKASLLNEIYSDNKKHLPITSGVVVIATAQLHQLSLNSGSAQVQILLVACRRFEMVRISDNGPGWK